MERVKFDKMNWSRACYKPSLRRYYNGWMFMFSVYKYSLTIDFRGWRGNSL